MEAKLLTSFADVWHITITRNSEVGSNQESDMLVWRKDVANQMSKVCDTDHLIGAHVVGMAGAAVHQQAEEPMGQVFLVQVSAQGGAVAGDSDGIGCEGIADEVTDGEVRVERQVGPHEGKAAGHNGFQAMLLAHQCTQVFGSALGLAVGCVGFC